MRPSKPELTTDFQPILIMDDPDDDFKIRPYDERYLEDVEYHNACIDLINTCLAGGPVEIVKDATATETGAVVYMRIKPN